MPTPPVVTVAPVRTPVTGVAATQSSGAAGLAERRAGIPSWANGLTRWLDDVIRIPGTNIGIGLDSVLGFFVPTLGDAATGIASIGLLWLAFQRRVPRVVLARMLLNIAIDAIAGAVPILGDVFDVAWKANRKNLELIERYAANPSAKPRALDYLLVGVGLLLVMLAILLPIAVIAMIASSLS